MNAIILAAGRGSRLQPLTNEVPKPLLRVDGTTIIERQICFLRQVGVSSIHVVIGYKYKMFAFLEQKYNVNLIVNPLFETLNNFYSLYLAEQYFGNSYVLEGDVYLSRNFLKKAVRQSTYFIGIKKNCQHEWLFEFSKDKLQSILLPGEPGHSKVLSRVETFTTTGVSHWTDNDAIKIKQYLRKIVSRKNKSDAGLFWDNIIQSNLADFNIGIELVREGDWVEVDDANDLLALPHERSGTDIRS